MNVTGRGLSSWSFCSDSGASHLEATAVGIGEGGGEGREHWGKPFGASERTAFTYCDSETLPAEDSSSGGSSAEAVPHGHSLRYGLSEVT